METGLETATKRHTHTVRDSAEAIAEIRLFLEPEHEEPEHEEPEHEEPEHEEPEHEEPEHEGR